MTTVTIEAETRASSPAPPKALEPDMIVHLGAVGWDGLLAIETLLLDRRRPRILYDQGQLALMTPSKRHERRVERLDSLVKTICEESEIAFEPTGATLFQRKDLDRGIMSDLSYYLEREAIIREVEGELDLDIYPPPDLIIEVEFTHPATLAVSICQALEVPEVWVYDDRSGSLRVLHLDGQGKYQLATASRAFPSLAAAEILSWVTSLEKEGYLPWLKRLRAWVRETIGPHFQR